MPTEELLESRLRAALERHVEEVFASDDLLASLRRRARQQARRRLAIALPIVIAAVVWTVVAVGAGGGSPTRPSRAVIQFADSVVTLPAGFSVGPDPTVPVPLLPSGAAAMCLTPERGIVSFVPGMAAQGGQQPGVWATSRSGGWLEMYLLPGSPAQSAGSLGIGVGQIDGFVNSSGSGVTTLEIPWFRYPQSLGVPLLHQAWPKDAAALVSGREVMYFVYRAYRISASELESIAGSVPFPPKTAIPGSWHGGDIALSGAEVAVACPFGSLTQTSNGVSSSGASGPR